MLKAIRKLSTVVLASLALVLLASYVRAQSVEQTAINRADAFLRTAQRGRTVCGYVHFGAQYKSHAYRETRGVQNRPGHFGLVYRFNWENDGITDVAFVCDPRGNVYQVQVLYTNAVLQQPYTLANASINLLGNALLEAFRNQMTRDEQERLRRAIDNPNSRELLEIALKLQQTFGQ